MALNVRNIEIIGEKLINTCDIATVIEKNMEKMSSLIQKQKQNQRLVIRPREENSQNVLKLV